MKITREMIEKSLETRQRRIVRYRETLVREIGREVMADSIGSIVHAMAREEGEQAVFEELLHLWDYVDEPDEPTLMRVLLDLACRHLDDTWSGRGNEIRRCRHEGRNAALQQLRLEML